MAYLDFMRGVVESDVRKVRNAEAALAVARDDVVRAVARLEDAKADQERHRAELAKLETQDAQESET